MKEQFLKEFKMLLEKYDVCVGFDCAEDTDLKQIEMPGIVVVDRQENRIWLSVDGYGLVASDIEVT
ncbi:MAG: hypothetical protein JJW03_05220 [Desulfosarcina sp.]|nr:hypothetical protein [Desulfobacterales bacterium]